MKSVYKFFSTHSLDKCSFAWFHIMITAHVMCSWTLTHENVDCSTAGSEKLWKKKTLIPLDVCERKTKMQAGKEIVFHWHERIDFNFFSNNFCEREVEEFFCKLNLLFILLNSSLSLRCAPQAAYLVPSGKLVDTLENWHVKTQMLPSRAARFQQIQLCFLVHSSISIFQQYNEYDVESSKLFFLLQISFVKRLTLRVLHISMSANLRIHLTSYLDNCAALLLLFNQHCSRSDDRLEHEKGIFSWFSGSTVDTKYCRWTTLNSKPKQRAWILELSQTFKLNLITVS